MVASEVGDDPSAPYAEACQGPEPSASGAAPHREQARAVDAVLVPSERLAGARPDNRPSSQAGVCRRSSGAPARRAEESGWTSALRYAAAPAGRGGRHRLTPVSSAPLTASWTASLVPVGRHHRDRGLAVSFVCALSALRRGLRDARGRTRVGLCEERVRRPVTSSPSVSAEQGPRVRGVGEVDAVLLRPRLTRAVAV